MQKSEADWNPRRIYSEHPACHFVKPIQSIRPVFVRLAQSIRPVISSGLFRASGLSFRRAYSLHPPCHIVRPTQYIRPVISSGLLSTSGPSFRQAYSEHSACHIVRPTQSIPRHPYSERLVTAVHATVNCTYTFKSEFHVNFRGP
jgi:hypothetical protein